MNTEAKPRRVLHLVEGEPIPANAGDAIICRTVDASKPQQTSEIITNFAALADRLAAMASDWRQGQFKASDLADADTMNEGLRHLLVELRRRDRP